MIGPVSDASAHPTPEDWRILRALSFYRLLLVTLQLVLFETGYTAFMFAPFHPGLFYSACVVHAVLALLLMLGIVYRRPPLAWQAHGQFFVDTAAITALAYACGGVPSGIGMLVITSAVGCSMVISPRMALVQAAGATLLMFAEETYRLWPDFDTGPIAQTGILGLMFFATTVAANAVAMRARKSEALAAQVGSDLVSLARLNESVIEHMQPGVAVVEPGGRIRLLNAAAAAMLEGRAGDALAERAPALAQALEAWREGRDAQQPLAPRPAGDEVIPRFSRLGWGDGVPVLILLDNARTLRDQALQMNLAALGRLSAGIAHEIRNPLTAISHAGQLMSESNGLSTENQKLLSMIRRHAERIDKIVKDVLALSRRDAPALAPIRLKPWLEQAVAQYSEAHVRAPRTIRRDRVGVHTTLRFDPLHLQQVLFNLWDNSFIHGGGDGRRVEVEVATGPARGEGGAPWLEIRDNGPGIPPDLRERVFEPFFSTAHGGTGLGLYLARELCEYNHCRLTYRSTAEGACFRLAFAEAAPEVSA
ncbi:MAG TPA: ATP-binding protein [Verrucomicrobiae bacterium]|nr:ATP-binding protein [Verrucomicrobiae bacterium]